MRSDVLGYEKRGLQGHLDLTDPLVLARVGRTGGQFWAPADRARLTCARARGQERTQGWTFVHP